MRKLIRSAIVFAFTTSLFAQGVQYEVQSRLVLVPVSVTDAQGRTVDGLESSDFLVLDEGRPQAVALDSFGTGLPPIALAIAVQSSGISAAALEKVQNIGSMIQPLITGQRGCAAVLAFDEDVRWLRPCSSDPAAIARSLQNLRPGKPKSARMLDAAYQAIQHLREQPNARRILFLISESRDRTSETSLDDAVFVAQTADVTIYSATYSAFKTSITSKSSMPPALPDQPSGARRPPKQPQPGGKVPKPPPPEQQVDLLAGIGEIMRLRKTETAAALAAATGGRTFSFSKQKGLERAIEDLGTELHSQYVLSFSPESSAPGYRRLQVQVTREGEYHVRARLGYWLIAMPR